MPFPQRHLLVRANGQFGSASVAKDFWSAGLRLGTAAGTNLTVTEIEAFLSAVKSAYSTFHGASAVKAGDGCFLTHLTGAQIGTDGKYDPAGAETAREDYSPVIAGNTGSVMPYSTAFVYSLRTGIARGYASNGRMYWPACSMIVDGASGRRTTPEVTASVNAFKTLVDALNVAGNAVEPGMRVRVYSQVGAGLSREVTHVRADGRLDSQERREDDVASTWFETAVA
jgi:hypothetical protein